MGTSLLAGVFAAGSLDVGAMDFSGPDFEKTILGEAVKGAGEQLAAALVAARDKVRVREMPVVGLVVLVEGERVVLNMGSRAGMKVGDRLPVEPVTQEVKDPCGATHPPKTIQVPGCILLLVRFVLHERKETPMWPWFHSGWIIIVPIAMMVVCFLMCVFMRGHVFGGCASCCGHGRSESDAQSNRKPQSDSRGSTA